MKTIHMITILLAGTSLQLFAQMPQGPPPDPVAMALDKNRDQKLSASEISSAARSLNKLDKDNDKALSAEELRGEPPKGRRKKDQQNAMPAPPPSTVLTALDTDQSGDLSKEELAAASQSLLTLDDDKDGKLSKEEAELPEPPQGGGGQGGGPPQGGNTPPPPPPGGRR